MKTRTKSLLAALLLSFFFSSLAMGKPKPKQYAHLNFLIVRDSNGKPVRNAAIVLHAVKKNGDQALGGMELKSEGDGKTDIGGIPYGKLRVQVIAPHLQTFGQDYDINQPAMQITIKLQEPKTQYSI